VIKPHSGSDLVVSSPVKKWTSCVGTGDRLTGNSPDSCELTFQAHSRRQRSFLEVVDDDKHGTRHCASRRLIISVKSSPAGACITKGDLAYWDAVARTVTCDAIDCADADGVEVGRPKRQRKKR
jgi:hypothetical protein